MVGWGGVGQDNNVSGIALSFTCMHTVIYFAVHSQALAHRRHARLSHGRHHLHTCVKLFCCAVGWTGWDNDLIGAAFAFSCTCAHTPSLYAVQWEGVGWYNNVIGFAFSCTAAQIVCFVRFDTYSSVF